MVFGWSRFLKTRSKNRFERCTPSDCGRIESLEVRRLLTAWYVATTGAASNNGTLNQPFATIQEAANVAQAGDTVYIMGGAYHETVTPPSSGTTGQPITFEPYDGQSVTIDGADPITGWSPYQGSIYSAPQAWDLGEGNNQVFVDGTMVNEARWPNTPADIPATSSTSIAPANISTPTWATATSVKVSLSTTAAPSTVTIFNASLNQPAGTWVGSIAHMVAGDAWIDQVGTITASAPGSITLSFVLQSPYQVPQAGNPFYIVGNFKALDTAGEWYRDPASGNVYLWGPAGDSPANHTIEAKARDFGFDLSGLSDIDVTGIDLFACTINTDANSSNNVLNGISAQYVSQSIGITPDTVSPWKNTTHPHSTGIIVNGTGNILENSTIAFSSGDGVFLGGSGNTVENTVIHDVDYEAGDEAGVDVLGSDETILNNTIYNAGRSGIVYRLSYGSLISHNVIHTIGLQVTDLGGIYTFGTDGNGTEISYNVLYDIHSAGFGAAGVYLDNTSQNFIVDHNVAFDCDFALKLNPPSWNNLIVNNTFVGTQYALQSSGNEDMAGSVLTNNIFVGPTMFGSNATHTHNIASPTNPHFVDAADDNYQLLAGSPAINSGIAELPYTANVSGSAPDSGAYEYGLAPFAAGAPAQPFIAPMPSTSSTAVPATPSITWATPTSIQAGTALDANQLDAASSIAGTFAYTPAAGAILGPGNSQTLSVTFTPTDTVDYTSATASVTLAVMRVTPTITWPTPASITIGTALSAAQFDATSSVPGTFVYTPAAGTILGPGVGQDLSAVFTPTDSADYVMVRAFAAINITKLTPTVTWPNPASITPSTALGASQLDATSPVAGTFVYNPPAGSILGLGDGQTLSVTFTPTDTVDYTSVTASATIDVAQVTPAITWPNPASITPSTALSVTQLDATTSVAGTFVYTPPAGTILSQGDGQTLSVTFTPTDTIDYTSVTASATIDVAQATPTITWPNPASITPSTALSATQLDATTSVAGTFVYTPAAGTILDQGDGQSLSVTFTPTDTIDYASATASAIINVAQATPTINWPNPSSITYGTPLSAAQLDATSPVAGTYVYTPAPGTILNAGSGQTLSVTFTPTDSIDYTTVTATTLLTVSKAKPNLVWSNPAAITYGTALTATQLDATSPVAGTFVYTPAAGAVLSAGTGKTLSVNFTPTDAVDYTNATAAVTITVQRAALTVTAGNKSRSYGTANPALTDTLGGFINGDSPGVVSGVPSLSLSASATSVPGIYPISVALGTLAASNYTFNLVNGSLTVSQAATKTTLVSTGTTVFGQALTFTATVTPATGTPTGTVQFAIDGKTVGSPVTVSSSGKASYSAGGLAAGSHSVVAVFSGNTDFATSVSTALSQTVNHAATATALTSSSATAVQGQSVTFTATVAATGTGSGTPTGTITFKDGTTVLKVVSLVHGVAKLAVNSLSTTSHAITAIYSGDSNFNASTSKSVTQTIKQAATTTTLATSAAKIAAGQPLTLTATITPISPGAGDPTGTVTFKSGSAIIGTMAISAGKAVLVIKTLAKGTDKISASYSGDKSFIASISAAITEVIS